jgi:hypothetical protein
VRLDKTVSFLRVDFPQKRASTQLALDIPGYVAACETSRPRHVQGDDDGSDLEHSEASAPRITPSASPIATPDGRLYWASPGRTYVLKATPKLEVLATNDLDDGADYTSAAVSAAASTSRGTGICGASARSEGGLARSVASAAMQEPRACAGSGPPHFGRPAGASTLRTGCIPVPARRMLTRVGSSQTAKTTSSNKRRNQKARRFIRCFLRVAGSQTISMRCAVIQMSSWSKRRLQDSLTPRIFSQFSAVSSTSTRTRTS